MKRRSFIKQSTQGIGGGLLILSSTTAARAEPVETRNKRNIWVASLSLEGIRGKTGQDVASALIQRMNETLVTQPDLICLTETFPYVRAEQRPPVAEQAEEAPGAISSKFIQFAKDHHCYVICPILTKENGIIYNTALVIDRQGGIVGRYHKIHPTVDEIDSGVVPGDPDPPVFDLDFGRVGIQICFDVNWPDAWQRLKEKNVELIVWPSAFPGGRMLNGWAWMTHSYVVTSTWPHPTRIIDMSGDEIAATGQYANWISAPINLEKALIHIWPYMDRIKALHETYKNQIRVQRRHDEGWALIESLSPELPIQQALKEFEIPTHKEHIRQATEKQRSQKI